MSGDISAAFTQRAFFMCVAAVLGIAAAHAQTGDPVYQQIDAAVHQRVDNVAGFTDTEKYSVYRGGR